MSTAVTEIPHGVGVIIMHPFAAPGIWMSQRSPNANRFPNYWQIPGGKVEEGESAEDAAIREVKEETGLVMEPHMLWPLFEDKFKYSDGTEYLSTNFVYFVDGEDHGLPFKNLEPDKQSGHICVVPASITDDGALCGMDVMASTLRAITETPDLTQVIEWLHLAYKHPRSMNLVKELAVLNKCPVWSDNQTFSVLRSVILKTETDVIAKVSLLTKSAWEVATTFEKAREFLIGREIPRKAATS